jgi:hypothetical protein
MVRALAGPEIEVSVVRESGVVLGAFQRPCEIGEAPIARRASGGAAVRVGEGTVHAVLALPTVDALADAGPQKILNRYVRPLLKAITRTATLATYFGRDWVSAGHRPCAYVCFAHEADTQRTSFEAFVAVRTPFAVGPRASFLGKEPATLEQITRRSIDPARVAEEIASAYARAYDLRIEARPIEDDPRVEPLRSEPPWTARVEEAIGPIWADPKSVGGELMASRDALQRANAALARTEDDLASIGAAIDAELKHPNVALEGVRSLRSLRDAVAKARGLELG